MSLIEKALGKMRADAEPTRSLSPVQSAIAVATHQASTSATGRRRALGKFDPTLVMDPSKRVVQIEDRALRDARILAAESEERRIADEYRAIKRAVIRAAFDPDSNELPSRRLVAMTSALPGDGKTHSTINLALSLAREKDHQVVMVDADVAKPHVSTLLGIEREPGLLDVLGSPERTIRDTVLPTNRPQLWVVPAGTQTEQATELLASGRMSDIADELVALFPNAIILFDAPPLLLTSEAKALVAIAGQILLVVRAGTTPKQAVMEAVEATQAPERVRLVLNHVESDVVSNYYYGNWYGYGAQPGSKQGAAEG